uniref:Wsv269-like protein n=1 Tax=Sicyonia whispovirus TaxID=2984283 RepID=A0A9C7F8F7_9VIRU|nr:MAG: wsv269-like protein [Sicyonia whispovirus]
MPVSVAADALHYNPSSDALLQTIDMSSMATPSLLNVIKKRNVRRLAVSLRAWEEILGWR